MHYYKFNIADWNLGTAHLSLTEEAIYFRLINFYYDTEQPIPLETHSVFRRLRMANESDTAQLILEEFFTKTDRGYIHSRCDDLLKEYRKTLKRNRSNGAKGGRPRKDAAYSETQDKPTGFFSDTQSEPTHNPNQEPITNNQELIVKKKNTKKKSPNDLDYSSWPEMPTEQVLVDWKDSRQKKRAAVSQTVVDQFGKELTKAAAHGYTVDQCLAECVTRGWQGFKFEWIQNSSGSRFAKNTNNTGENHESVTDAEFFGNLDPEITGQLFAEPASDISGLEGRSVGRSSSVDDGIQTPAAKRVC